jgi:hypothetical protein
MGSIEKAGIEVKSKPHIMKPAINDLIFAASFKKVSPILKCPLPVRSGRAPSWRAEVNFSAQAWFSE